MSLSQLLAPWSGTAVRHLPHGSPYDVRDLRFAGLAADNRWNVQGEPTLYLASGREVALAEFARHFKDDRTQKLTDRTAKRQVYRLGVKLDRILKLSDCYSLLPLPADPPACFLNRATARATAHFIRSTTVAQGILVPSVAFLERDDYWTLVLFLEHLPADPREFLTSVRKEGTFKIGVR